MGGLGGGVPGLESAYLLVAGGGRVPLQPRCLQALGEAWAEQGHNLTQPGVVFWSRGGASCSAGNSNQAPGQGLTCAHT